MPSMQARTGGGKRRQSGGLVAVLLQCNIIAMTGLHGPIRYHAWA
jgi:hypothetical protein